MSKLPIKLQPLKASSINICLVIKISKGDGAFSSHIHVDALLPIPFVMEHQYEVVDPILAQKNIAL
jgi:hypothetical protein